MTNQELIARVRELDVIRRSLPTATALKAQWEIAELAMTTADALERALAELTRCREENDKLRADKERLDWMIEKADSHFFNQLSDYTGEAREQIDAARQPTDQ